MLIFLHTQDCVVTPVPVDYELDFVIHYVNYNFLNQEPDYLLTRFDSYTRAIPNTLDVLGHREKLVAILRTECSDGFFVVFGELLLKRTQIDQPLVPTPFQLAGNESVTRIHLVVLTMRARSLEPRLFKCILELPPLFGMFLPVLIHRRYRCLNSEWLHSVKDFLRNGAVNSQTTKGEAKFVGICV